MTRSELCCWVLSGTLHLAVCYQVAEWTLAPPGGDPSVSSDSTPAACITWTGDPPSPDRLLIDPIAFDIGDTASPNPAFDQDIFPRDSASVTLENLPREPGAGTSAGSGPSGIGLGGGNGGGLWCGDRIPYRNPWSESPLRLAVSALPFPTTPDPSPTDGPPVPLASNPKPRYPESARRRGEQGTVIVTLTVDEEGHCTAAEVKSSSGSASLDEAAVAACLEWRFTRAPRSRSGPRVVHLPIRFAIRTP